VRKRFLAVPMGVSNGINENSRKQVVYFQLFRQNGFQMFDFRNRIFPKSDFRYLISKIIEDLILVQDERWRRG